MLLQLQPQNPYYIDAKAHLLYRSCNIQEAIREQQHAIDAANDKQNPVFISKAQLETMQSELANMEAGKL